ncbi:Hypothetical protein A7982_06063 [Minicystis rosea]|nr:Hypothetical protein A7982_06063 [Minicystis rosea]
MEAWLSSGACLGDGLGDDDGAAGESVGWADPTCAILRAVMMRARRLLRLIARVAGATLALLAAILVINTLRLSPPKIEAAAPPPPAAVPAAIIAQHLGAAIRIETISHEDAKQDEPGKWNALHEMLATTYPAFHAAATRERLGNGALLYTWKGSDPSLKPVLFAAHMDVVPIEPGTEGAWTRPPFSGAIEDGYVWGRGALDDKGSLIGMFEAAESLAREHWAPRRTILFALGCDEERGGENGAKIIAATLAARGVRLDYALDEGMAVTEGVVPSVDRPVAIIGLGEKGYSTIELVAEMPGGHSSMPPRETAVSVLAAAVDRVARAPMPARLEGASRAQMEALAPYMPFGRRLALANLWLLSPVVRSMLSREIVTNAAIRTTTAPTVIEGGVKENVLPSRARALINFRILPGDTIDTVLAHVRTVVADPRISLRSVGHLDGNPAPLSSMSGRAYHLIENTIHRFYPTAVVVPGLVLGTTDARHYAGIADGIYHFAPFVLRGKERESLHGTNERMRVSDLETTVGVFRALFADGG